MVPTSIKVVSILGIILSGLTLLAMPCGMYFTFHPLQPNPAMDDMLREPSYVGFFIGSTVVRIILSVMLLVGSISSLKLKPVGRTLMISYSWALIGYGILSSILSYTIVFPRMIAALQNDPHMVPAAITGAKIGGIVGGLIGIAFYGAIAGVILFFFNRPVAKDAFKGIFPATPTNFPVDVNPPDSPVY